jgi:hypothetical protein
VIVADTAEEGLVEQVPGHVLHHRRVPREYRLRVDDLVLLQDNNNKNSDPQPALIWENMDEDLKKPKLREKKLCGRSLHRTGDISWKFCANDKQLVKSKFS